MAGFRQRVEQARARAKIAGANLWPAIGLQGDFTDTHNNTGDTQKESGQFTVAYEVDLWGANRARRDADSVRLLSSVFARDALQLVVMSNVGQAHFNLLALVERKRIATEFLENVAEVLAIVEARHNAGAVSALDVAQQQTELTTARASLDLLNQQVILAENALAILLGHPPQAVRFNAQQPAGLALAMASSLTRPLFQGGRLEGGLENAEARNAELVELYRKTILTAFKEMKDAAAVRGNSSRRLEALAEAVTQARLAYQLSLDRYRLGTIDYQTLLSTQRSLLSAENG